jgi:hypothetical protein
VVEVAVGVSIMATTEMPIIQWVLLHQVMVALVNIHLLCRSHLQAPACLMAQEDLQWAEGSRKTLAMPLSGIVFIPVEACCCPADVSLANQYCDHFAQVLNPLLWGCFVVPWFILT